MKRLINRLGMVLLGIGGGIFLLGCKTGNPFRLTTAQEIEIGNQTARELERQHGLVQRGANVGRVSELGQRLVVHCERPQLPYQFKVLNTDDVNALAVPGGHIYVTRGLLEKAQPDNDKLAGVIGHEIAHVARRHSAKMIEKSSQLSLLIAILTSKSSENTQLFAQLAQNFYLQDYSRQEEYEADWYGIGYAYRAGYDPRGLKRFFETLHKLQEGREPQGIEVYFSSHPQTSERIKRAEKRAQELQQGSSRS